MKMLISGNWVDASSEESLEVFNPFDGSFLDSVPNAAKADVDKAVSDAVNAQKKWSRVIVRERAKILRKFLGLLEQNREELAKTLTL